ncbi:DUF86 domain-containing protein [Candidatus Parcubacteria bacterium]|nr:DUF86 domain-containing protein [Patescibacteria group bacterium]MBU4381368.1 DUF86 domain-containing protein [Patescibacteria group bacterium]MCG2688868.1 DUF86 domain-containing protein [Candidatus Parcubacteria bacterium]
MKTVSVYLKHILEACEKVEMMVQDLDKEDFMDKDWITREAILRQLEIIGEAVKRIPNEFKLKYSEVSWKDISGMRDYLVHEYFAVNYEMAWETAISDIPKLKKKIVEIALKENIKISLIP